MVIGIIASFMDSSLSWLVLSDCRVSPIILRVDLCLSCSAAQNYSESWFVSVNCILARLDSRHKICLNTSSSEDDITLPVMPS